MVCHLNYIIPNSCHILSLCHLYAKLKRLYKILLPMTTRIFLKVSHCVSLRLENYLIMICLIKTDILHYFNISDTLYDNLLIFKINKELFKHPRM